MLARHSGCDRVTELMCRCCPIDFLHTFWFEEEESTYGYAWFARPMHICEVWGTGLALPVPVPAPLSNTRHGMAGKTHLAPLFCQ